MSNIIWLQLFFVVFKRMTHWAELVFNLLEERLTAVQKTRDWRSEARFTFPFWSFSGNTVFAAMKWSLSRGRSERERQFALSPNSRTHPQLSAHRSCSSLTGKRCWDPVLRLITAFGLELVWMWLNIRTWRTPSAVVVSLQNVTQELHCDVFASALWAVVR